MFASTLQNPEGRTTITAMQMQTYIRSQQQQVIPTYRKPGRCGSPSLPLLQTRHENVRSMGKCGDLSRIFYQLSSPLEDPGVLSGTAPSFVTLPLAVFSAAGGLPFRNSAKSSPSSPIEKLDICSMPSISDIVLFGCNAAKSETNRWVVVWYLWYCASWSCASRFLQGYNQSRVLSGQICGAPEVQLELWAGSPDS